MNHPKIRSGGIKRVLLTMLLLMVCLLLSACYMEQDRVVDDDTNIGLNNQGQSFDTVLTPVPMSTPTPTPTVQPQNTSSALDWTSWDFGNDTATAVPGTNTKPPISVDVSQKPGTVTPTPKATGTTPTAKPSGAPTPTALPKATPTASTTLKTGATGSNVKRLQQRLKDLGYYSGSVDGSYGSGTEAAVRAFQKANGLTADGKAGTRTQTVLYGSSAKKATAGSTSKPKTTGTADTTKYTNGKTNIYLQLGSSGSQVKILQNRLIVLGYLSGKADGNFSETTESAVIAFQKRNSIYADGVAGPDTLKKLYSSGARKADGAAASLSSLREGMNGSAVRTLQKNLKKLGYYSGTVDGDYGAGTSAAVRAFQSANGLNPDGVAGKQTMNAISAAVNGNGGNKGSSSSTKASSYGKTASSSGYTTISSATTSTSKVKNLQSALRSCGYYSGNVDGSFGASTENAIKAYQKSAGLRVTGMAGPSTQRMLYGGTSESGSYKKLKSGDSGSSVKALQYALYELKYYDGDITGKYDSATENAVRLFQECNDLTTDGVAGQGTQRRLFSSNAIPCNR